MSARKLIVLIALLSGLMLLTGSILAHEGREIGEFELVFGWRNEPALVGYPNGPELFIRVHEEEHEHEDESEDHEHEEANPLEAMEISLQVEISFGPATVTRNLRQDFSDPTHFIADLIPTRPGDYSFRVFGTIADAEIDEVFTSADGEFSSVEPASDMTFPDELPSIIDLLERIAELEAQIEALQGD